MSISRRAADNRHPPAITAPWRQPARVVAVAGWVVAVGFMLAVIASVAQQQSQRGHRFEYADLPAQPARSAPYALRDGARVADLDGVDLASVAQVR